MPGRGGRRREEREVGMREEGGGGRGTGRNEARGRGEGETQRLPL